ncbi:MAK10-like protein [Tanacetum coccineum]
MENGNPPRTLGDYSRPSREGYRNTIELLDGNNVVPLRSDTIRLVQNKCSFHGLRPEDPNQHLKDFLKIVDILYLNVENRERTRLRRTAKLQNDILMFQQHQGESLSEAWTRFKAINDRLTGALPSDKVKIPKLNVNPTSLVSSARSYPTEDPQSSSRLADGTKSYPVGILRNVEVHIGKLKLLEDFYVIDMEKDPTCPLLVGRGFLATASAVIDYKKAKIAAGEGITSTDGIGARPPYYAKKDFMNHYLPGEWEIARDAKLFPFKDVLVFRKMVEFLGTIPINLKGNMWESEEFIEKKIDWNKPSKEGDGAWDIKIELIDPDGEKFNRTFQSIPTTRKLSEKDNPSEIIDLKHFHDS